jgi:hypothetical protein
VQDVVVADTSPPKRAGRNAGVDRLLIGARRTLAGETSLPPAHATRAAALFTRCAVESLIDSELDRQLAHLGLDHESAGSSTRVKLVCLAALADRESVAEIDWCWNTLSVACHHHAYELSPTHHEVAHLIDRVAAAVER